MAPWFFGPFGDVDGLPQEEQLLRPRELLRLWRGNRQDEQKRLLLVLDSCFSGHWVRLAEQDPSISVQAAATTTQTAAETPAGGNLTRSLVQGIGPAW